MKRMNADRAQPPVISLSIPVYPYLKDHRFEGKVILPAVEALQHLARAVRVRFPHAHCRRISAASFDRFIIIPQGASRIEAVCRFDHIEGCVAAVLETSVPLKNSGATRTLEHARARFSSLPAQSDTGDSRPMVQDGYDSFSISAERLYAELVPFGAAFQTVQDQVALTWQGAQAKLLARDLLGATGPLGSSFPFDGSLHAACAWAQRYCGKLVFPIGFDERAILQPIAPGETVFCAVIPVSLQDGMLRFDIRIEDDRGCLREVARRVAMKDTFGGRIQPPQWVRCGTRLAGEMSSQEVRFKNEHG